MHFGVGGQENGEKNFDISTFASKLLGLAEVKLIKEKKTIKEFIETKKELDENENSPKALRRFIDLVVTRAWYYKKKEGLDYTVNGYIARWGSPFNSTKAKEEFKKLVEKYSPERIREENAKRINEFLEYVSIKNFTTKLHELSRERKTVVLGEKGRDNYLRDVGYFDRVPIDIHEMRFMIRTGIFHYCSDQENSDPLEKQAYHKALTNFCNKYMKDSKIEGINLKDAPGLIDMFIWPYCAINEDNICSKKPNCKDCSLQISCLYSISQNSGRE